MCPMKAFRLPTNSRDQKGLGMAYRYTHVMGAFATLVLSQVCFVQASDFVEGFIGGSRLYKILPLAHVIS
jgi:hypothetical protein